MNDWKNLDYIQNSPLLAIPKEPLETLTDSTGFLDIFLKVGCIGDSLASGESVSGIHDEKIGYNDLYDFSWGQYLARKTGNTYYNWSSGGLTTYSWLHTEFSKICFDSQHLCSAYIIGLAQNDSNGKLPLGSRDDIHLDDCEKNPDTYYGLYGKIIQKIKAINPKAKFFVITDMCAKVEEGGYNAVIRDMPVIFENVYLLDFYKYGRKYYDTVLRPQFRHDHYNAVGYKICAMMIANYIDWIVKTRPEEFTQVEFIGTDHEWIE